MNEKKEINLRPYACEASDAIKGLFLITPLPFVNFVEVLEDSTLNGIVSVDRLYIGSRQRRSNVITFDVLKLYTLSIS
jgi:hypothetical protein